MGAAPARTAAELNDDDRRRVTETHLAVLESEPGHDLADLTNAEFARGLERVKLVQERIRVILDTVLVEGGHFGNPNRAFKHPILYQAGAEELRRLMRFSLRRVAPDEIIIEEALVSVIVFLGIYDGAGRLVSTCKAACTSVESRFKRKDGKGWIYDDPREKLHDCIAMAEKRASVRLTREASGATAFLANEEEMEAADKPASPWTEDERRAVFEAAAKKRMGRADIETLTRETLGRTAVGTGEEVDLLLAAIKVWEKPKKGEAEKPTAPAPEGAAKGPEAGEGELPLEPTSK